MREGSKKAIVLELIRRPDGASLKEIMDATGWQAHSVRGFISGSLGKKMGLTVESFKRPMARAPTARVEQPRHPPPALFAGGVSVLQLLRQRTAAHATDPRATGTPPLARTCR